MGINLDPFLPSKQRNHTHLVTSAPAKRQGFCFPPYAIIQFDLPVLVSQLENILKVE
jgi:hypothetical protein